MSISSESCDFPLISKSEFLASLPPWRRFLARLNWHPTVDAQIRSLESERRTQLLESEIAQLDTEIARLDRLISKADALLLNHDSSSQTPPATDSN